MTGILLRIAFSLIVLSGYPALAWWIRVNYSRVALVLVWLGAALLIAAPILQDLLTTRGRGPTSFWFLVASDFLGLGLGAWSVARSVARHPDPPIMIPAAALARSMALIVACTAAGFAGLYFSHEVAFGFTWHQ